MASVQKHVALNAATIGRSIWGPLTKPEAVGTSNVALVAFVRKRLCLGNQQLVDSKLIRRPGTADLDWLNDLVD